MSFAIGIPTLNRYDLLMPSLMLYKRDFPDIKIYVLDNGNQGISQSNITLINFQNNIGVGASWNMLCDRIFEEFDNALILNDDIYFGKRTADIEDLISKKKHKGNLLKATADWCAFIIPKKVYRTVGRFDECFFPAYYEDKSYEYRMKLMGLYPIKTPLLNPYVYRASQTLEKAPAMLETIKKNKQLYIDMWGGEPEREKFKTPFDK
jgi:GT2 family glycosyltransferase